MSTETAPLRVSAADLRMLLGAAGACILFLFAVIVGHQHDAPRDCPQGTALVVLSDTEPLPDYVTGHAHCVDVADILGQID